MLEAGAVLSIQWSAVTVTAVKVTVGYSDSFGNPRFITEDIGYYDYLGTIHMV